MSDFIDIITIEFKNQENKKVALEQKVYMRNQFEHFGLKSNIRRAIQLPFLTNAYLPDRKEVKYLIKTLWQKPQREFQYVAQELAFKYVKEFDKKDITLLEYMITHKSWWDTVDFIAVKLMGAYFKKFPEQKEAFSSKWLSANNIWLQRSAFLFQLKYKSDIDSRLLSSNIHYLLRSKEFFINKAIGWALREYSRTNPEWVYEFATKTTLSNLSKKEALRLLK